MILDDLFFTVAGYAVLVLTGLGSVAALRVFGQHRYSLRRVLQNEEPLLICSHLFSFGALFIAEFIVFSGFPLAFLVAFGVGIIGIATSIYWTYFQFRSKGLKRELFNKALVAVSALTIVPLIFSVITFILTFNAGVIDLDPPHIGLGVILVAFIVGLVPVEDFRNRAFKNRAGLTAGLEALNLLSYFSNILLILLIPLIIGVFVYAVARLSFDYSHTISYFAALFFAAPGYYTAFQMMKPKANRVTRGQEEGTSEAAQEKIDSIRASGDKGVWFGGVFLPSEAATKHFLFVGTTGSGKTVNIKLLMESALPQIKKQRDHKAIMFDAKRELYAYLLKKEFSPYDHTAKEGHVHTLNPFDERGAAWDIAKDIDSEAQAVELANVLIPPPEKEGDNAYFGKAARRIVTGVIHSFILTSDEREERGEPRLSWTLRDLILALRYEESIKHLLGKHSETKYLIEKYFRNEKTNNDVLSTLDTAISDFNIVAALWEHAPYKISLREWAYNKRGSIILLGWDKENKKSLDPLNRVIFQRLSDILINQDNSEQRRTWIFLDELREISKGLPGLVQLLNMGREKGACCVLGVIDIKGLMHSLGENIAEEVTGLCDNVAALRTRSAPTAKWLSEIFGNAEVKEKSTSFDSHGRRSIQESIAERKTFLFGQFQELETPSKENGHTITGYFLNAYARPYRYAVQGVKGWHEVVPKLSQEEINTYGIVPRPKVEQRLKLWDKNDLKRLEISLDLDLSLERNEPEQQQENKPKVNWSKFRVLSEEQEEENRYDQ